MRVWTPCFDGIEGGDGLPILAVKVIDSGKSHWLQLRLKSVSRVRIRSIAIFARNGTGLYCGRLGSK